ncbi:GNAT family N-acetyltransferase [Erwinia persicina]|uniref:GNAT family N-acetyltransferase n=1 Tax=Erwinia persicina TaxID=55211 RepID=UPI00177C8222|nr:GNAT family N-acetyltransferase [Erwinia persicina]MBD8163346.1 GNAT family N-acetyltransferase [Erwinia persicina]
MIDIMRESAEVAVMPVQQKDYAQWLPHWLSYQAFYEVQLSEDATAAAWQRFFDADSPIFCAIAREGETVIGFAHYLFHPSTWAVSEYCYLEDLFVAPHCRGRETGKQLIEYVQQQARARQCDRLYWHTQEKNATAQRLYDRVAEKPGVIQYRMPL